MSEPRGAEPTGPTGDTPAPAAPASFLHRRALRRRERMIAEIERNRRGGHALPTWVLAAALLLLLAGWATLIVLA